MRVGVVGGGVSGLYCAWRLAEAGHSVEVFEGQQHVGGRIDSDRGPDDEIAEQGAMRFALSHALLIELIDRLGLRAKDFASAKPQRLYLRERKLPAGLLAPTWNGTVSVPYALRGALENKGPFAVLRSLFASLFPDLQENPLTLDDPQQVEIAISKARFQSRPFYAYGFWNLAEHILGTEEYDFLRDTVGIESAVANWNAHRAIVLLGSLLHGLRRGPLRTIEGGMEQLVRGLKERLERAGVRIRQDHVVQRVVASDRVLLKGSRRKRPWQRTVDEVVLAVPPLAMAKIKFRPTSLAERLNEIRAWVRPTDATRIYLRYERAWWPELGYGITTLPLRQVYYWSGVSGNDEPGLLMASYTDAASADFWEDASAQLHTPTGVFGGTHGLFHHVTGDDWLVEQVTNMLEEMHRPDLTVPRPTHVSVMRWDASSPPGCAWHAWRPQVDGSSHMVDARHPYDAVHVIGEAWSNYQGWIEGALSSVEHVLVDHFGLQPLLPGHYLGP